MMAVDANFSSITISRLIDLGCDVNAKCEDGMTALHKSIWVENIDNYRVLLERGANPDIEDNDGDTAKSLSEDKPRFKSVLETVMNSPLAISMTKSQFEKIEAQAFESKKDV